MKKAEATRLKILQTGFELIYENGYQTTSIDDITGRAGITKGAFYYYFKTKDEMGLSIINQMIKPAFTDTFRSYLQPDVDPIESIYKLIHHLLMKNRILHVEHGCPASNLIQEMTPWHAQFSGELAALTQKWVLAIARTIETGKSSGFIRADVDPMQVSLFVISGYWGIRNLGKLANSQGAYLPYLKELKNYLNLLRQENSSHMMPQNSDDS